MPKHNEVRFIGHQPSPRPCPLTDPLTDGHGTKVPPFQRGSLSSARHSVEGIIDKARHLRWIKAEAPETAYTTSQRTPIGPFN
mgnify:FL=1